MSRAGGALRPGDAGGAGEGRREGPARQGRRSAAVCVRGRRILAGRVVHTHEAYSLLCSRLLSITLHSTQKAFIHMGCGACYRFGFGRDLHGETASPGSPIRGLRGTIVHYTKRQKSPWALHIQNAHKFRITKSVKFLNAKGSLVWNSLPSPRRRSEVREDLQRLVAPPTCADDFL